MKFFVTGGAGFIGSNFIHYLLETYSDDMVINFDALTYAGNIANVSQWEQDHRYTFIHGDICDEVKVRESMKDVDVVVHFAAESHVDRSIKNPDAFVRTNVLGTNVLLASAREHKVKRFHHVSTDEVFGALGLSDRAFSEKTPYAPNSPYSASKAGSDHLVRAYGETYNLPISISHCSNNYGPMHYLEKLIPLAITNILEGKKVPVYGKGDQIRDWLYVQDHCRAIDMIVREGKEGGVYCIGGGNQPTNREIVKNILSLLGKDETMIDFVKDRAGHDFRYEIDFSKISRELGWQPLVSLQEGLEKTVLWYKENTLWWKPLK
ncbi:MAG: dTDP-glucose 4,6-dehydratase [Candidatus Moranbacteria bacterium]|nr:dTDP-glucose 4,6-dehydratase [Candidatus Moranbacteria bacterium]